MWARIMAIYFMAMMLFTALSAIASNAQQQVYAIDVEAGKWYAFRSPYDAPGVSAIHKDYGNIPVYRWDLNTSYFIFYAPAGGRVYILPSSVTNTVINTQSWFTFPPVANVTALIYYVADTVSYVSAPYNATVNFTIQNRYFNGTHVVAVTSPFNASLSFLINTVSFRLNENIQQSFRYIAMIVQSPLLIVDAKANGTIGGFRASFYYGTTFFNESGLIVSLSKTSFSLCYQFSTSTSVTYNATTVNMTVSISCAGTTSGSGPTVSSVYQYLTNISLNYNITFGSTTLAVTQAINNVITASNGNVIVLASPAPATADISIAKASLALLATQLNLSTNTTSWVLISLPAPPIQTSFINPVLVTDKPYLGYYTVIGGVYYMFFKTDSPWSGTAYIAWTFPQTIATSVKYDSQYLDLMNYIVLVNGTVNYGSGFVIVSGALSFYNYYRLILVQYTGGTVDMADVITVRVNNATYIYTTPSALINANSVAFDTTVLDITPPAPITFDSPVYINYTVVSDATTLILPVEMLSSIYSVAGTWGYRIPVYITLGGSPMGLPVFRLELPLGQWIRQGLLSIGLEDLLIVDSENKPVYFYVSHWSSADTAVVYVRLNKPPVSSTVTLYVLLYNRALWGIGVTYASIMTFDFVNPSKPFPVYGLYNTVTLRPIPQSITFYTTSVDYVTYHRNGTLVECHGSFCTSYAVQPILGGQELVVRISNSTFSFFIDGQPAFSIDIASLTYYQNISLKTIQFIEYDTVEFATHYHSVPYTYSIGYLQGGLYVAPQLNQKETTAYNNVQQESPWAMFMNILPLMIILVILGIVMKFISQPHGGSNQPMVNLP